MDLFSSSQMNAEFLRAFYSIFESYLQSRSHTQPILPLTQKSSVQNNSPVNNGNTGNFQNMIDTVSAKYQVDAKLVKAVVQTESNFNANAVSAAGAEGLMQLMPATAGDLGVKNALDPMQNLDGGVRYLRQMLDAYNGNVSMALAAYNAGPGAVNQYGGVPPYQETQTYVNRVLGHYNQDNNRSS